MRPTAPLFASALLIATFAGAVNATAQSIQQPPSDSSIKEISGIVGDPDGTGIWVHQDAGKPDELYKLSAEGDTLTTLTPSNLEWEDQEDIGVGPLMPSSDAKALYVADTGDAANLRAKSGQASRKQFQVSRTALPEESAGSDVAQVFDTLRFRYPDGWNRNAEAMLVDPVLGNVFLVNKVPAGKPAEVWRLPVEGFTIPDAGTAPIDAELVGSIEIPDVSGGAVDPYGRFVALRNGTQAFLFPTPTGLEPGTALLAEPTVMQLPPQPQGEAIAVISNGAELLLASEGSDDTFAVVAVPETFLSQLPPPPAGMAAVGQEVKGGTGGQGSSGAVAFKAIAVAAGIGTSAILAGLLLRRRRQVVTRGTAHVPKQAV